MPPCPTKSEVEKYLDIWNDVENLHKTEEALRNLFKGCHANNKDGSDVLVKVYALNNAFNVFMLSQVRMAKHITNENIDDGLRLGDLAIIDKIRSGHGIRNRHGTEINFYSFATKYCSFHEPDKYPLFDSNVKRALIYFKTNCSKEFILNNNFREYKDFRSTIENFQKVFGLQKSFRNIDKYLYLVGRELNPPKKKS